MFANLLHFANFACIVCDFGFWILNFRISDFGVCTRFGSCIALSLLQADSGWRIIRDIVDAQEL